MQTKAALGQNGARADAEMLATVAAAVRHRLEVLDGGNRVTAAMGASDIAIPAVALEVEPRGFLIREALEELIEANGFRFVAHET